MITRLKITGFKSFHNFEMEFSPFTIVAGLNASGKSNLFDALSLLSRLAETDLKSAFGVQRGDSVELFTQYGKDFLADEMSFEVDLLVNRKAQDNWSGEAELKYTRLRYKLTIERRITERGFDTLYVKDENLESIRHDDDAWVRAYIPKDHLEHWRPKVKDGRRGKPYIFKDMKNGVFAFKVPQDGKQGGKETPANAVGQTVLSGINSVDFPHAFAAREEMRQWKFLQLNPEDLRQPSRQEPNTSDTITQTGKNLAAALYRIQQDDPYAIVEISRMLNRFLPNYTKVESHDDRANRQFLIKLQSEDGREFTSRTLSEGTLRLLALCILQHDRRHEGLLCFEEPENGIHPARVEAVLELLVALSVNFCDSDQPLRQVILNTHSPLLVKCTLKWHHDKRVAVWLSQWVTLIENVGRTRMKFGVTKMLPLEQNGFGKTTLNFTDIEKKWTLQAVQDYLSIGESELGNSERGQ